MSGDLEAAVTSIIRTFVRVQSGRSEGARGVYAADGKGTLRAVIIDVDVLELLEKAYHQEVDAFDAQKGGVS